MEWIIFMNDNMEQDTFICKFIICPYKIIISSEGDTVVKLNVVATSPVKEKFQA